MTAKTWFITGASSGFGRAFAEHAVARGHKLIATARTPSALDDIVARAPDRVLALALDVTRPGDARAAIDTALARFGRIDVLVNNAGYGIVGAFEETPDGELRALMETNFFGVMKVTRAALPALRAQRGGAIVNISSLGGQLSFAGFSAYSATKFAIEGVSKALAQELGPFGVKVLIVEPGQFRRGKHAPYARDWGLSRRSRRHAPIRARHAWDAAWRSGKGGRRDRCGGDTAAAATWRRRGRRCQGSCPGPAQATRSLGAACAR
jgi:NAD(P)-dependent dehydrogenase (short-subunit alcohol dehydrogenase family)